MDEGSFSGFCQYLNLFRRDQIWITEDYDTMMNIYLKTLKILLKIL